MSRPVIKPTFLVIGAAKAGTTSLYELLGAHPEVFLSDPKEPQFFTERYARGYGWYESLFADAAGYQAVGEGSTTYSELGIWPQTIDRLAAYVPEARFLYFTRHPLERLESMWIQLPSSTKMRHGLSGGALNGISTSMRPFVPQMCIR